MTMEVLSWEEWEASIDVHHLNRYSYIVREKKKFYGVYKKSEEPTSIPCFARTEQQPEKVQPRVVVKI